MMNSGVDHSKRILTIPNLLSGLRIALIPAFAYTYCAKGSYWSTACILALSGLTDAADGFIARRFHMVSDLGKILDPIADKLTQAAMLLCLAARFPMMILLFALMAFKELVMGLLNLAAIKRTGRIQGALWHGKLLTFVLYGVIILHILWPDIPKPLSHALSGICLALMLASFALYGIRNMRILRSDTAAGNE